MKISFIGAGSTIFARNVLGDCMASDVLRESELALYDIDYKRMKESEAILSAINRSFGGKSCIKCYLGIENRKEALSGASFVVNAIQVGGYEPCTVIDFDIPKKYGLRQTIADTLGIGGIMRGLRTIPVMKELGNDMEEVCPDAWLLNYTNPMSILTGYMLRYTGVKTVGLCHSVQVCSEHLLKDLGMEKALDGRRELIAGINHMGWLLAIQDKNNSDLYPEIKRRAAIKNSESKHNDMVRYDLLAKLGYYCTESSEHNAEYSPFYIKARYPGLIDKFNIPLDEYSRRCVSQIAGWKSEYESLSRQEIMKHERSHEYASRIMESIVTNAPYKIGGNVLNTGGQIENLPKEACVEIPCLVDGTGVRPAWVGRLPVQLAAMNMTNINVHQCVIEAAHTQKREHIYHAAFLDPHTASELSLDDIVSMLDEMIEAHGNWLPMYK